MIAVNSYIKQIKLLILNLFPQQLFHRKKDSINFPVRVNRNAFRLLVFQHNPNASYPLTISYHSILLKPCIWRLKSQ